MTAGSSTPGRRQRVEGASSKVSGREPRLPEGFIEGRHTPLLSEANLPGPLSAVHRTTVWASLHCAPPHPDYDIDVLEGHRHLHDHQPFTPALFDRWLQVFLDSVDGGWSGANAALAKKRATGMARAMSLRYLGKGAWKPGMTD